MKQIVFFKMLWKKYFTFPVNLVSSLIFPIVWIFIFAVIYNSNTEINTNPVNIRMDVGTILIATFPTTIFLNLPILIGGYRVDSIYKYFPIMQFSRMKFLLTIFLQYFLIYLFVFNLQYIIFLGIYPNTFSAIEYLLFLGISFFAFCLSFLFCIGLSMVSIKERKNIYLFSLTYFLLVMITSGFLIPITTLDANYFTNDGADSWFKWVQYVTPVGWCTRIYALYLVPKLWSSSDILLVISPLLQVGLLSFWIFKKFTFSL